MKSKLNKATAGVAVGTAIAVGLALKSLLTPSPVGPCGPNAGSTSCNQGATCKLANGQTGLCGSMASGGGCPCEQINSQAVE